MEILQKDHRWLSVENELFLNQVKLFAYKLIGVGESQKVTIKEADFETDLLLGASTYPLKLIASEKSSGAYIKVYGTKMEPLSGVTVSVENSSSKKVSKLVTNKDGLAKYNFTGGFKVLAS
jgi:hypothetical protein